MAVGRRVIADGTAPLLSARAAIVVMKRSKQSQAVAFSAAAACH